MADFRLSARRQFDRQPSIELQISVKSQQDNT